MVFRERRHSRHRATDADSSDAMPDHELDSFLAAISPEADAAQSAQPAASALTERFGSAQVFQLRLPSLRLEQLRRLAEARDMAPTALVLDWIVERLDQEDPGPTTTPAPRQESNPASVAEPAVKPAGGRRRAASRPPTTATVELEPARQPATASLDISEPVAAFSPLDQLRPAGELTPVSTADPEAPVTPLFRNPPTHSDDKPAKKGPRHRAPEPITSLHTRRKF
ncbi:hypothetical protein [Pseudonocardia spinosispora]|uniref:hypothetical protein n=1 Tax=Pseudonocardia spinosispora TaxID=103441 RepID=UPI0006883E34|nr:hypothetical protein [Pseudonocardia spinosispora]